MLRIKKSDLQKLNRMVEILKTKQECIKVAIITSFQLVKIGDMSCNNLEHSGASYDSTEETINNIFSRKMIDVSRCFDEFQFVSPTKIIYGSKKYGNYRECEYGNTDGFRNAIWIHTNALKELIHDLPYTLYDLQNMIECYTNELNAFFHELRMVTAPRKKAA